MATPKVITLNDLAIGKIILQLADDGSNILHAEAVYRFLDDQTTPQIVDVIDPRRVKRAIPWASIPVEIREALTTINTFLYNSALADEGME